MKIGKGVAPMKTVFLSVFCLVPRDSAITIKFNILDRDRVCGDEEMKREKMRTGNSWLLKLWTTSQFCLKRQEQVSYFNFYLARRTGKFSS